MARGAKSTCDRYFSQIVRMRGACQRCGSTRDLQCAHIVRRRFVGIPPEPLPDGSPVSDDTPRGFPLRHNGLNAWSLCAPCHQTVDTDPVAFAELVAITPGFDVYEQLLAAKNAPHRPWREADWIFERKRLRLLLNTLGATDTEGM